MPRRSSPAFWVSAMQRADSVREPVAGRAHFGSSHSNPLHGSIRLLGFRSGTPWHQALAWAFIAALYAAFVLTMFPPVAAGNRDVLVYKAIRLLLFATPILCVVLLSDFPCCKRLPLFSSERRSQRLLGVATLVALVLCLCANLMYLHTPTYRASLQQHVIAFVVGSEEYPSNEDPVATDETPLTNTTTPDITNGTSDDDSESLRSAWDDRREGCGTD